MTAEERASTAQDSQRRAGLRWVLFGLLLGVLVAGLVVSAAIVFARGVGDDPFERVDSLRNPPHAATKDRELALAAGKTFVERFNTYGPDLLDSNQKMPKYAAVGDLMTTKFAKVFADNVGYAEQTVVETGIDRKASVHAVGIASIDQDSATLLVGGIVEFSYPDPDNAEERIPFEPLRFRYEVELVKQDGRWLVDDFDDIDDDLPSFGDSADQPGQTSTDAPTSGAPSSDAPSSESSESGATQPPASAPATPGGSASP